MEGEIKKIVSHLPPRNFDDFLAIAFLKNKFPEAQIEYVHPQRVPEDYLTNPQIILVDVGGRYDPENNNYDHHQNLSLPSSFVLVIDLVDEVKKYKNHPVVEIIDHIDKHGVKSAAERYNFELSNEIDEMRKAILMLDIEKHYKDIILAFKEAAKHTDYNEFLKAMYNYLDKKGLLDDIKVKLAQEKEQLQKLMQQVKIFDVEGLRIGFSLQSVAPYHSNVFNETKIDLLIERNKMNPKHTSFIRNSSSPKASRINLQKVFDLYPFVFIHPNGFIAVCDVEIEKTEKDIEKIAKLIQS